ncbi:(2Fe-2S)-binding protein [Maledivibacter halophilus]|uniref:Carbon-monoxide dehydrogenase small subunit n=1 Tax=Maledivibacter halophilus TaxID=36842 RepID=A0A1T5KZR8_9FIRM|nr:(2Fe-2S)-binding protein [Maledivibacter halophilus]SKC69286.1 carbon-monoxide dehydrogenase small subunit [Maledivibacter halophilus]
MDVQFLTIEIEVNGTKIVKNVTPSTTLLELIRNELNLKGTKQGCDNGNCGACTVLMDGKPVNSCITLAAQADGKKILTIEGLSKEGSLDPIQKAFVDKGAVQCGFCTPGMVMSAKGLLDKTSHPDEQEIREAISGNYCRCTGYTKIIEAIKYCSENINDIKEKEE